MNLVGESVFGRWNEAKKRRILESRVKSTRHVVEGWRGASSRPRALISGSAIGYYGHGGERELTEEAPPGSGFMAGVCQAWENEARVAETLGARVVLLRTALPLDPSGGFLGTLLPIFRAGLGGKLGDGRQWMAWIHMEDWLNLVLAALDREDVRGPLNLCAPHPVRNETFTEALGRVLGRPTLFRVPALALELVLGEMADEMPLVSQRVLPAHAQRLGYEFRFSDLEPALHDLLD